MATRPAITTVVSTKGQVILPKSVRTRRGWTPGTELIVEEAADGVLLKAKPVFKATRPAEVYGSLRYEGAPKSVEEMNAAIAAEAKRRHARDRH